MGSLRGTRQGSTHVLCVERFDASELFELRLEVDGFRFEFGDDGLEVKGELSRSRVVLAAGGFDCVEGQAEVFEDALSHFEATEGFAARPVKEAMEVAALAQFEKDFGHIGSGAGLAYFIAEELGLFAGLDRGDQFLMYATPAAGTVAHENRDAEHDGIFGVVFEHLALRHELSLPVEISRRGHVGRAVGLLRLAVENHIRRDVD